MSTFARSFEVDEFPKQEEYAQIRAKARSLRAKTKLLRLEHVNAMLDVALNVAGFPDANASNKLVSSCLGAALKTYKSVRSMVERGSWTEMDRIALEQRLERLRALLEGGKKAIVDVDGGADAVVSARLDRESAIPTNNGHHPNGLTTRELQVLKCIAEGNATKEVAAMLGITFKTAACHRYRIMDKLGIHSTASLVRYAIRTGLVSA